MTSGGCKVDVRSCPSTNWCAINHRASFLPLELRAVHLMNVWGPGYRWSLVHYLNMGHPPPYIHLASSRCHAFYYLHSQASRFVCIYSVDSWTYTKALWKLTLHIKFAMKSDMLLQQTYMGYFTTAFLESMFSFLGTKVERFLACVLLRIL